MYMKKMIIISFTLIIIISMLPAGGNGEDPAPRTSSQPSPYSGLFARGEFSTDYNRYIDFSGEIMSGGVGKDGIPAIDNPRFNSTSEADRILAEEEPVLVATLENTSKIYPLRILMWHEIVNDTLTDTPIAVTYCPLCNTGIGFNREVEGRTLDFGTTGRLRYSNLIMYDRQTETWWQQATGRALIGRFAGKELELIPILNVSWGDAKESHPEAQVLSPETGYNRPYGENPYVGYDDLRTDPFLYQGPAPPDEHRPLERALVVHVDDETEVYPYSTLETLGVLNDEISGTPITVFWQKGTASALDASAIPAGRDVGSANAFSPIVDEKKLTFTLEDGSIIDSQTGSEWNILGEAVDGPLKGASLEPYVGIQNFWFSAYAFQPQAEFFSAGEE
jgi:hypothetical protein